jgi:serpin B
VYNENAVWEGEFTNIFGDRQSADFMYSGESRYLDDGMATGFVKPYAGGRYAFAALLPNEGVSIETYIASLTGDGFISTLRNSQNEIVHASMPKFEFEYSKSLVETLKALGIPAAFDVADADFSRMGSSSYGNIFIDEVLHKTFISVDELGTRAGAVTVVVAAGGGAMQAKVVRLDRPFVFAIIDTATNLPLFIGTVLTV